MRLLWFFPLLWALCAQTLCAQTLCAQTLCAQTNDGAAVRKVIAAFNDPHQRASVLTPDADLDSLSRYTGPELSQVYFEVRAIRFVTPDVAVVDAAGSQYGSLVMKRSLPAFFVLKKVGAVWRVDLLRVAGPNR